MKQTDRHKHRSRMVLRTRRHVERLGGPLQALLLAVLLVVMIVGIYAGMWLGYIAGIPM